MIQWSGSHSVRTKFDHSFNRFMMFFRPFFFFSISLQLTVTFSIYFLSLGHIIVHDVNTSFDSYTYIETERNISTEKRFETNEKQRTTIVHLFQYRENGQHLRKNKIYASSKYRHALFVTAFLSDACEHIPSSSSKLSWKLFLRNDRDRLKWR